MCVGGKCFGVMENVGNSVEAPLNTPVRVCRFFCDASSIKVGGKVLSKIQRFKFKSLT